MIKKVPTVPVYAIQLSDRIPRIPYHTPIELFKRAKEILPHLEDIDVWEVCRAYAMIYLDTPQQLTPPSEW